MNQPARRDKHPGPCGDDPADTGLPVFRSIFGAAWEELPVVMHRHYSIRPCSADRVVVEGQMDIESRGPVRILGPLIRLIGLIPPYNASRVPVTVVYDSGPDSRTLRLDRTFHFPGRRPHRFRSSMRQLAGNEVVELMRFGIGWRMRYLWQHGRVILRHEGYLLNVFGLRIPLPLTCLLGACHAEEKAVDDHSFDLFVEIRHRWWGKVYGYRGRFTFGDRT